MLWINRFVKWPTTETPYGYQHLLQESDSQDHKTLQLWLGSVAIKKKLRIHGRIKTNVDTCQLYVLYGLFTAAVSTSGPTQHLLINNNFSTVLRTNILDSCTSSSRDVVIRMTFPWQFVINGAHCVSYFFSITRHPSCRSDEINSLLFQAQTSINTENVTCTGIFMENILVPEMKRI